MKLYIATYATKKYRYALPNFGRRVASAIAFSKIKKATFLFIGDQTPELKQDALKYIADVLPKGITFKFIGLDLNDANAKNYDESSQLLIAQLQSCAFTEARKNNATHFWSLESDVLVPPNSLSVSLDILKFDNGYYDVAMCSYPSQGGGCFLGGRGSYQHPIGEDFTDEERNIPDDLLKERDEHLKVKDKNDDWHEKQKEIRDKIKECEPKDNVYGLNAKKWRARGWMEYSYPAIGKGAIVPTDWVGLGCTMLSQRALALAHFDGYEGFGTQDLYLGWHRWKPSGLNLCVTTHAICDHVIRLRKEGDKQDYNEIKISNAFHEPEGECVGHLRQRFSKHYRMTAGELPIKDGHQMVTKPEEPSKIKA